MACGLFIIERTRPKSKRTYNELFLTRQNQYITDDNGVYCVFSLNIRNTERYSYAKLKIKIAETRKY